MQQFQSQKGSCNDQERDDSLTSSWQSKFTTASLKAIRKKLKSLAGPHRTLRPGRRRLLARGHLPQPQIIMHRCTKSYTALPGRTARWLARGFV